MPLEKSFCFLRPSSCPPWCGCHSKPPRTGHFFLLSSILMRLCPPEKRYRPMLSGAWAVWRDGMLFNSLRLGESCGILSSSLRQSRTDSHHTPRRVRTSLPPQEGPTCVCVFHCTTPVLARIAALSFCSVACAICSGVRPEASVADGSAPPNSSIRIASDCPA